MKVSIQIPTFNQEKWIKRTIESALAQNYSNLEVIVLDDCSTDNTFSIAKQIIDPRLKVFSNSKNIGRVKTYHKLLNQLVTGNYVVNLDGDDYYTDSSFIKDAMNLLIKHPNTFLYLANNNKFFQVINHCKPALRINYETVKVKGLSYFKNYYKMPSFSHLGAIYNREIAIQNKFYTFESLISDFCSIMTICKNGDVLISKRNVGCWNNNNNNESNKNSNLKELEDNINDIKILCEGYKNILSDNEINFVCKKLITLLKHFSNISALQKKKRVKAVLFLLKNFSFDFNGIHLLSKLKLK